MSVESHRLIPETLAARLAEGRRRAAQMRGPVLVSVARELTQPTDMTGLYASAGRLGTRHPAASPFQAFATADGHIVVALLTDDLAPWRSFRATVGRDDLAEDRRFADNRSRTDNQHLLEPLLAKQFVGRPTGEWLARLEAAGIPCGPINSVAELAADPQVAHRGRGV